MPAQSVHFAAGLEAVDAGHYEIERRCYDAAQRNIDVFGLGAPDLTDESHRQMHILRIDPFRAGKTGAQAGDAAARHPETRCQRAGGTSVAIPVLPRASMEWHRADWLYAVQRRTSLWHHPDIILRRSTRQRRIRRRARAETGCITFDVT